MSAFVVEDKTINQVVTWMEIYDNQNGCLHRQFAALGDDPRLAGWEGIGIEMFKLNVLAVDDRYGACEAAQFRPLDYTCHTELADDVQVYKSLQCWLYQCSEGDIPETPLFKLMAKVQTIVADQIISSMPQYEKATWH